MKKILFTLAALIMLALPASSMSYEQARQQALFLTDKMAYELNLSEDQYEAAYEINLDYLMSVNTVDDLYGNYWRWRNLDLSYVLLDWQYRAYCEAAYFYRPLRWEASCWHFGIYARYPHRDYFYFGRPTFYGVYRGGHAWRHNGGRSWYHGRHFDGPDRRGGMRDGFGRGDFGHGYKFRNGKMVAGKKNDRPSFGNQQQRSFGGGRSFGNQGPKRESSTRTTVRQPNNGNSQRTFGGQRPDRTVQRRPSAGQQGPSSNGQRSFGGSRSSQPRSTFTAPSRPSTSPSRPSGSFGGGSRSGGSAPRGGGNSGSPRGSFGGHR